jgi:hypothetical protein
MIEDSFQPPWTEPEFVPIDEEIEIALRVVVACEACETDAEIPFDWIIDKITGCDPLTTEYVMSAPAKCPKCGAEIHEKTLVEWNEKWWLLQRTNTKD